MRSSKWAGLRASTKIGVAGVVVIMRHFLVNALPCDLHAIENLLSGGTARGDDRADLLRQSIKQFVERQAITNGSGNGSMEGLVVALDLDTHNSVPRPPSILSRY